MDLFEQQAQAHGPLADRMRPRSLDELVGQRDLLGEGALLARLIRADRIPSMILWGPPGTGKTTLARVIAHETAATFVPFSAVLGGVPELRKLLTGARERRATWGKGTLLFVDEIHRFNKAQQDALLPHVESGQVTLVGATTENPSFAVNAALLSRARVFRLQALSESELVCLLERALTDLERGLGALGLDVDGEALEALAAAAHGDARRALSVLEIASDAAVAGDRQLTRALVEEASSTRTLLYDKSGEEHYNVTSALIKSMRGSDPDAAIYWMMRMIDSGEDPRFVLRRMLIFASEDVGNADPRALSLAVAADATFHRLGMPEGLFAMAQLCTYLASAPKSNASYKAFTSAREDIERRGALPVPLKLRNAPTRDMKAEGYGQGYRYPHDEGGFVRGETYLPEGLEGRRYYHPVDDGLESRIRARLARLRGEEG
ncbi:MAG: replication-associated recombination protein A [Deltaproteobacteria bacterium]|nr:replication-associated recombination protein A [Deltaproteobacteria bacterium]